MALAKFSQLIRMVLQNASEEYMLLSKELELIKIYVEMEQMRFENNFEFILEVDRTVDSDSVRIPGMIIQPFIENAIWHGIMPLEKKRKGKILLKIVDDVKELKIYIEDNGIGREASGKIKKDIKHRSLGLNISEQRLKLIDNDKNRIIIMDIQSSEGVVGTRVEIHLAKGEDVLFL